jgi:hypothetical protein
MARSGIVPELDKHRADGKGEINLRVGARHRHRAKQALIFLQELNQQLRQYSCVLRAYVYARMDSRFLLAEFEQKLEGVMAYLKTIRIAGIPSPTVRRRCR